MSVDTTIGSARDADDLGPADIGLLKSPLEFILADHHRQRSLCCLLEKLADASMPAPLPTAAIIRWLEEDLPLHVLDEEEDLFPLVRRRARPEDNVERVLGLLSREHDEDDRLAGLILHGLRQDQTASEHGHSEAFRASLRAFAHQQRRHLAVENAIVMPLAEARLTSKDRDGLARRMAARRGILLCERSGD